MSSPQNNVLLLASFAVMNVMVTTQAVPDMTAVFCNQFYNNMCNIKCANNPIPCYYFHFEHVCPCLVKCHEDHCMTGVMAEVCPACAAHDFYCKGWHDYIELHSCGSKRMDTRTALREHCISLNTCVGQCPLPGQCLDGNDVNIGFWDLNEYERIVNGHLLGNGK